MNHPKRQLGEAVRLIREGGVVIVPTDTVYCLAADARNAEAVERVYRIKQRGHDLALPVLAADVDQAALVVEMTPLARFLAKRFWPGGLTMVLNRLPSFPDHAGRGLKTLAVRVPDHEIPRDISRALGSPITGTSANIHGYASPVTGEEAAAQVGALVDCIVDGGRCQGGVESTVVDVTGRELLVHRSGAVAVSDLTRVFEEYRRSGR